MIIRGTTQRQFFRIPFAFDRISGIYVSYTQQKELILEKAHNSIMNEVKLNEKEQNVEVFLSREDTLKFKEIGIPATPSDSLIYIQVHVELNNGEWYSSVPIKDRLYDTTKGE